VLAQLAVASDGTSGTNGTYAVFAIVIDPMRPISPMSLHASDNAPVTKTPPIQFTLTHVLLMMAAIGVWLAAWRLQDPVLTFLIILPGLALGPILLWQGHLRHNRELSAAGSVITYAAPVVVVVLIGINALVQLFR